MLYIGTVQGKQIEDWHEAIMICSNHLALQFVAGKHYTFYIFSGDVEDFSDETELSQTDCRLKIY